VEVETECTTRKGGGKRSAQPERDVQNTVHDPGQGVRHSTRLWPVFSTVNAKHNINTIIIMSVHYVQQLINHLRLYYFYTKYSQLV